jgi:hypothetical protein
MILLAFIGLQVMDTLTTLLFLHQGVREGNPLMRVALSGSLQPQVTLILTKIFAITLATFAWRTGRIALLRKMNVLFALFVAWNLVATLVAHASTPTG